MAANKLNLLLKLEQDKEEQLKANFAQAQQHLSINQQKLAGLNDFRLEYTTQLHGKAQTVVSGYVPLDRDNPMWRWLPHYRSEHPNDVSI